MHAASRRDTRVRPNVHGLSRAGSHLAATLVPKCAVRRYVRSVRGSSTTRAISTAIDAGACVYGSAELGGVNGTVLTLVSGADRRAGRVRLSGTGGFSIVIVAVRAIADCADCATRVHLAA